MTSSQIHCFHVVNVIEVSEDTTGAILASVPVGDSALGDAVQQYWIMAATRHWTKWERQCDI